MERIPEPELMNEADQAQAYAYADFEEPHEQFVARFAQCFPNHEVRGTYLDLGCGPGDITRRFAYAYPLVTIDGIDGAEAMLTIGRRQVADAGLEDRIQLTRCFLPDDSLPNDRYNGVISNSLLHHLANPDVLWETIREHARPRSPVFVMDLMRPADEATARALVNEHSDGEPEILRRDFYNSLLAAYEVGEVEDQLDRCKLGQLTVEAISDRHWIAHGFA